MNREQNGVNAATVVGSTLEQLAVPCHLDFGLAPSVERATKNSRQRRIKIRRFIVTFIIVSVVIAIRPIMSVLLLY